MDDFLEIDEKKKTINSLNLDDFSVEDLEKYILELKNEIKRADEEIVKKNKTKMDAQKFWDGVLQDIPKKY